MSMETKVYNRFNRPPRTLEKGGGKVLVDKAGYVSGMKRIEAIMNAGQRLVEARREEYDSSDGSEPELDPTRNPGFDLADATSIARPLGDRLKAQRDEAKKKAEEKRKAEQDAEDERKYQERRAKEKEDKV